MYIIYMYYNNYQCVVSGRAVINGIKIVRLGDHRRFAKDVSHLSLQSLMKEAQTDYPKQGKVHIHTCKMMYM